MFLNSGFPVARLGGRVSVPLLLLFPSPAPAFHSFLPVSLSLSLSSLNTHRCDPFYLLAFIIFLLQEATDRYGQASGLPHGHRCCVGFKALGPKLGENQPLRGTGAGP